MNDKITYWKEQANKFRLQDSYAGLVLGAIIVVVLGLLVANYFTRSRGQLGTAENTIALTEDIRAEKTHKVASGESLSIIADKVYGDMSYWPVLASKNNILNPDLIFVDAQLTIPSKPDAEKIQKELLMTIYDVQEGDTLFGIAEAAYGDGFRWQEIAWANKVGYLPNGNPLIYAGSSLVIPR